MHITYSSLLGMLFLGLAFAATFTMFHFWGYPYDEDKKKSSCPQWKMNIHRGIGLAYVVVYVLMMTEMVPRLWEYQVEFAPRTVVHIVLGTTIGVILIIKISILRFFRHFEEWMPVLGVGLLLCTVLLGVMSAPAFFRERALASEVYSTKNLERVARLLPEAGFPEDIDVTKLGHESALERGRRVLLDKCVVCHDLKTVIAKPRTPSDWVRTSKRMVEKPSLGGVISPMEGHLAAAYLIAITPDLQRSAKLKRAASVVRDTSMEAAGELLIPDAGALEPELVEPDAGIEPEATPGKEEPLTREDPEAEAKAEARAKAKAEAKAKAKAKARPAFDRKAAKELFEDECSLCHEISDVDDAPPTSRKEVSEMLVRMIDNGLDLEKDALAQIRWYLIKKYLN